MTAARNHILLLFLGLSFSLIFDVSIMVCRHCQNYRFHADVAIASSTMIGIVLDVTTQTGAKAVLDHPWAIEDKNGQLF